MKNIFSLKKKPGSVEDQAAMWVARRDGNVLSEEESQRFDQWKSVHVDHQTAYDDLEQAWGQMGSLVDLLDVGPREGKPDPDILAKKFGRFGPQHQSYRAPLSIAASILLIFGIAWSALDMAQGENVHTTDVGEVRSVALADGSEMILNTDTRVSVHFDNENRLVELKSGEAYFKVAKDPERPFLVVAGKGEIMAVGTEFNVHFQDDVVEVVVAEGVVELLMSEEKQTSAENPQSQRLILTENQGSGFNGHLRKSAEIDSRELKRLLSWQNRKLEFDNETLDQVVQEIERYTNKRIFFASESLKSLRIGGIYEIGDVDGLVEALQDFFPIKAVQVTHYVTVLVATDDVRIDARTPYRELSY